MIKIILLLITCFGAIQASAELSVFGESRFFNAVDGLSHQATRSYVTQNRDIKETSRVTITKYGAGGELHHGSTSWMKYSATRGSGFAIARLMKNLNMDAMAGANLLSLEHSTDKTISHWETGFYFFPKPKHLYTLQASEDFVYYDWLEAGAIREALTGKTYLAKAEDVFRNEKILQRSSLQFTDVSDHNAQFFASSHWFYELPLRRVQLRVGPGATYYSFRRHTPAYWSPTRWLWTGGVMEASYPVNKSLTLETKAHLGPVQIQNERTRMHVYTEADLKWAFSKSGSATLSYGHLDNSSEIYGWHRESIGLSLTTGI